MKGNLSLAKKAKLLKINRSTIYYQSCKKEDVDLMNEIRDLYEKHCFLGYRWITEILNRRMETKVNRKKVLRLMRKIRPAKQKDKSFKGKSQNINVWESQLCILNTSGRRQSLSEENINVE